MILINFVFCLIKPPDYIRNETECFVSSRHQGIVLSVQLIAIRYVFFFYVLIFFCR